MVLSAWGKVNQQISLSQGGFHAAGQLVGAGSAFASAVVALEHVHDILSIGPLQQLCYCLGIARAAPMELYVIYFAVLE